MVGAACLSPFQGSSLLLIIPGAACPLRSHSPLATFGRAWGATRPGYLIAAPAALSSWLPYAAPAALLALATLCGACGALASGTQRARD
jgi:hypothetical protein